MELLTNKYLVGRVKEWAHQRNILEGSTPAAQALKLVEEVGEVIDGIQSNCAFSIEDGIGDTLVVIVILATQLGLDAEKLIEDSMSKLKEDYELSNVNDVIFLSVAGICSGIAKNNASSINMQAGLGGLVLLLEYVAKVHKLDTNYCFNTAWNAIRNRKGKMVNGIFVKEEDLVK